MSKKILFFDIDGTLINRDGIVPASAKRALEQARHAGHEIVICSGRSGHQLSQWMYDDFDGIINCTGARVVCHGTPIYEHFIPREEVKRTRETVEGAGGLLIGQTDACLVLSQECYDFFLDYLVRSGRSQERIRAMLGDAIITPEMEAYGNILKFCYYRSQKSVARLEEELGDVLHVEASSFAGATSDSGEITWKGINKSFGMQRYIAHRGFSREDTVAFGDGPNDLDMLAFANIGVAMGNAGAAVKSAADFVTKDINDHGIAYALQELGIIPSFSWD